MASNVGNSGKFVNVFHFPLEVSPKERDLISNLRSQLNSMMTRLEELQRENDILLSRISRCQCSEGMEQEIELLMDESCTDTSQSNVPITVSNEEGKCILDVDKSSNCTSLEQTKQSVHHITRHKFAKRFVALKIIYFGHRFYGFASEAQMEPTVESEFFKALDKTKLLVGTRKDSHYSRCGRTDKGVSSTGQVVSLYIRSNGKDLEKEINYVMVLNRVLPKDIRVIGATPVSSDFSARFSCLNREYMYLFWRGIMDITVMQKAAGKFIGEHDFRNFCKMDALNVNNYKRRITEFSIRPYSNWSYDDNLWAITIKGSAFLWHQVRCMVSILFMIGEGLESPNIIDVLLDIKNTARKPQYAMASELPLLLRCCGFQDANFICSSDAKRKLEDHLTNELRSCFLKAATVEEALKCLQTLDVEESPTEHRKKKKGHIPLMLRPTEPSYEERRSKLAMKALHVMPAS